MKPSVIGSSKSQISQELQRTLQISLKKLVRNRISQSYLRTIASINVNKMKLHTARSTRKHKYKAL